ncbi:Putative ammonium transporter 1, partial [Gryllus bimaculatus]
VGLGGLVLIAGFLAFNGGSVGGVAAPGQGQTVARVMAVTVMGGAGGALTVLALGRAGLTGGGPRYPFAHTLNAAFAGMPEKLVALSGQGGRNPGIDWEGCRKCKLRSSGIRIPAYRHICAPMDGADKGHNGTGAHLEDLFPWCYKVSVCAAADVLALWAALVAGVGAGALYLALRSVVWRCGVDDPLDVVAVHGGGGAWGLLAASLFAGDGSGVALNPSPEALQALLWRVAGGAAICAWALVCALVLFGALRLLGLLRVSADEELR